MRYEELKIGSFMSAEEVYSTFDVHMFLLDFDSIKGGTLVYFYRGDCTDKDTEHMSELFEKYGGKRIGTAFIQPAARRLGL